MFVTMISRFFCCGSGLRFVNSTCALFCNAHAKIPPQHRKHNDIAIKRSSTANKVPEIIDGGNYVLTKQGKVILILSDHPPSPYQDIYLKTDDYFADL